MLVNLFTIKKPLKLTFFTKYGLWFIFLQLILSILIYTNFVSLVIWHIYVVYFILFILSLLIYKIYNNIIIVNFFVFLVIFWFGLDHIINTPQIINLFIIKKNYSGYIIYYNNILNIYISNIFIL